jgi:hypothetical protein
MSEGICANCKETLHNCQCEVTTMVADEARPSQKLIWQQARCPICGQVYSYAAIPYKPHTCGRFECVQQYLHPELKRNRHNG